VFVVLITANMISDDDSSLGSDCVYYTSDSFRRDVNVNSESNLLFLHHNIRSFHRNFDELSVFLENIDSKFHVIILTETWFTEDNKASIDGYNAHHLFRDGKTGGGVSIYVCNSFSSKQIDNLTIRGEAYEVCAASVSCGGEIIYFIGTYRPPNDVDFEYYLNRYIDMLINFNTFNKKVYIAGDFNVDTLADNNRTRMFTDAMRSLFMLPLITIPTRVTDDCCSLIDNIWTNQLSVTISGVFLVEISDHFPIFVIAPRLAQRDGRFMKYFRDHSAQSLDKLEATVEEFVANYNARGVHLNDEMSKLLSDLMGMYDRCCVIRSKICSVKSITKPWINREIRCLITRKHYLFRQYKSGVCSFEFYNRFKNTVSSSIKLAKREYFRRRFNDNSKCSSDMWKLLNKLIERNRKPTNFSLTIDGSSVIDDFDVGTVFNDYFSSVAERISTNIPQYNIDPLSYMTGLGTDHSFFAAPSMPLDVYNIISSMKLKGAPLSEIPIFIYKRLNKYLCSVISDMFNKSLSVGVFPDVLKRARVIPIYKAGDKEDVSNYRPISTLSIMSKIFELLMCTRMKSYIERFSLLGHCQFGFRTNFSTADAITEFLDRIYVAIDNKEYFVSVFLDFQKAFDTVDHAILVRKLSRLGFRGPINDWFKSYLTNREQFVSINGIHSQTLDVVRGVPQGSVLGPLLFNLYIGDMHKATTLGVIHYADDTTVYHSGVDVPAVVHCVNDEMSKVNRWLCANKLSLNAAKSKVMLFRKKSLDIVPPVKFRDVKLDVVESFKFLGVTLDADLSFRSHSSSVISKLSRSLGIMRKLSNVMPNRSLLTLYYSLFYSHLAYSVVAWGNSSLVVSKRICSLQRQVVRLLNYDGTTSEKFIKFNIMTFPFIFKYFCVQKMYKSLKYVNSYFFDRVASAQVTHNHNTRGSVSGSLTSIFCRTSCNLHSFLPQAIRCWNNVPDDIRSIESCVAFKMKLRQFYVRMSNIEVEQL